MFNAAGTLRAPGVRVLRVSSFRSWQLKSRLRGRSALGVTVSDFGFGSNIEAEAIGAHVARRSLVCCSSGAENAAPECKFGMCSKNVLHARRVSQQGIEITPGLVYALSDG